MTKEEKNLQNAMTEGVIWKQLLLFFFPIVLGTFFQQLYNTADAIIVGKFVGKEALAAVGGTTGTPGGTDPKPDGSAGTGRLPGTASASPG